MMQRFEKRGKRHYFEHSLGLWNYNFTQTVQQAVRMGEVVLRMGACEVCEKSALFRLYSDMSSRKNKKVFKEGSCPPPNCFVTDQAHITGNSNFHALQFHLNNLEGVGGQLPLLPPSPSNVLT